MPNPSVKGTLNTRDWEHHLADTGVLVLAAVLPVLTDQVLPGLDLDPKTKAIIAAVLAQVGLLVRRAASGRPAVAVDPPTEKIADPRRP